MDDDLPRGRAIDRIIRNVMSGIDWGSEHVKSVCPPREQWAWMKAWNSWIKKLNEKVQMDEQKNFNPINDYQYQRSVESMINYDETPEIDKNTKSQLECGGKPCYIKMQDPCAPCCCVIECIEPPPCSESGPPPKQKSICQCNRKNISSGRKCCDSCGLAGLEQA